MKRTLSIALLSILIATGLDAAAAALGDPAPPISIERWIKGAPVRVGRGTNVYVVEFWATWCGPCKRSIPHLTELQNEYAGKGVILLGISSEPAADVTPFVAGQGNGMAYRVGVDPSERTFNSWMPAYGESGIPHAFVVGTNGTVIWHGYPDEDLDRALREITTGRFDAEFERNSDLGARLVRQYTAAVKRPNAAAAAAPAADKILSDYTKDWRVAHYLARAILTDPEVRSRDLELALRATTKAIELTRQHSAHALAMHARALYANGRKAEAVEAQKKAIALSTDAQDRSELEKFLAVFEKGAQSSGGAK
jgi:thiol-disulfide isomerase/thioredoxin